MAEKEKTLETVLKILKEEYGIQTIQQLDKAIGKLTVIDLTPFCGEIKQVKEIAKC